MPTATKLIDSTPFNQENLEERLIVALLLDTSMSMQGKPIDELINGLEILERAMKTNDKTRKRVELLLMTFGGKVTIIHEFVSAEDFQAPALATHGNTPMGEAILLALQKIEARKSVYKDNDTDYFRPLMIMISDGEPTDKEIWKTAVTELTEAVINKRVYFQAIGVLNANMKVLKQMSPNNDAVRLNDVEKFDNFFQVLSRSVAAATPHEQMAREEYKGFASLHTN